MMNTKKRFLILQGKNKDVLVTILRFVSNSINFVFPFLQNKTKNSPSLVFITIVDK